MQTVWTTTDDDGQTCACLVGPHEAGGVRVALAINGKAQFGRRCADQTEADYVALAWWQDIRRGLPSPAVGP